MHSCIYNGWVRHRRYGPRAHEFRYRTVHDVPGPGRAAAAVRSLLVLVDARAALARFKRSDYHGDPRKPLDRGGARHASHATTGRAARPGRSALLTHLRYFGYIFNPVSFYYCFDAHDTQRRNHCR